jgi:5-methylcytosine-specific restriction endonuclease McrA
MTEASIQATAQKPIVSRAAAISQGLSRYFTGKPCKQGHVAERTVVGGCIVCRENRKKAWRAANGAFEREQERRRYAINIERERARKKEWQAANPEAVKTYSVKYYRKNREQILAKRRAARAISLEEHREKERKRYAENASRYRETKKEWVRANPLKTAAKQKKWRKGKSDLIAAYSHVRRARKRGAVGTYTPADVQNIRKLQRDRCALCSVKLHGAGHVDHIIALSRGGSNSKENLQLLCAPCNYAKGPRDQIDFVRQMGRLL